MILPQKINFSDKLFNPKSSIVNAVNSIKFAITVIFNIEITILLSIEVISKIFPTYSKDVFR